MDWNPGTILETASAYWRTSVLHTAVKLELFSLIGAAERTGGEIAGLLNGDERAVTMLLNALTAMGLLSKRDGGFANTEASSMWLSKGTDAYLGHIIMHHHHLTASWARLDKAVVSGKPLQGSMSRTDEESWRESFLMGMHNMASLSAPGVAEAVDLSGRRRLLDLGGGPGTYAIHFCKRNPELRATIYDLPTTQPFAEQTAAQFGMQDRIAFEAGDVVQDPIAGSFDAIWISHLLHGQGPDACQTTLNKAAAALEPGGLVLIHEFILDDNLAGPLFPALFSLNMLLGTDGGQAYSETRIAEMLKDAGAKAVSRLPYESPNGAGIMAGSF
jgi:SAM-dependent methyltransferase